MTDEHAYTYQHPPTLIFRQQLSHTRKHWILMRSFQIVSPTQGNWPTTKASQRTPIGHDLIIQVFIDMQPSILAERTTHLGKYLFLSNTRHPIREHHNRHATVHMLVGILFSVRRIHNYHDHSLDEYPFRLVLGWGFPILIAPDFAGSGCRKPTPYWISTTSVTIHCTMMKERMFVTILK